MSKPCLMMVAGERSGDMYGAGLASAISKRLGEVAIFGCGGEAMRRAGVETVVDARDFAMVGLTEVVSGLPRAYRSLQSLGKEAGRRRPQLAILIDSPSLNLRLAKQLKRWDIPIAYFVSPQIWAWKRWRLRQLKHRIDKMVCIFGFEEAIYRRAGVPVEYVGHPLVDSVGPRLSREEFFAQAGLDPSAETVALLPGSREIEVRYNLPTMLEAAVELTRARPVQFVVALAPTVDAVEVQARYLKPYIQRLRIRALTDATYDALCYSSVAVVASGTATVEAALVERPMVVVYRVSPVTAFLARLLVSVPHYSMVNLLAGREVVKELIQGDFTASKVSAEVTRLLEDREAYAEMVGRLRAVKAGLGGGGALDRAAEAMIRMLPPLETNGTAG